MFVIKKMYVKYLIILIAVISIIAFWGRSNLSSNDKNINIYNVVKEAFLTDEGYSDELSKCMSEEVFKNTNIYNAYPVNSPEYRRPFKVDFSLKENSQEAKQDLVYVKMTYSVMITDSQGKIVGGSKNIPVTFTVKKTENQWYIIDKYEPA